MIRQLIEAFAHELRMLRLANALSKTDDAADTAPLESVQRRRGTVPADCPLPACSTCPSLDVVAEQEGAGETNHAVWWLISAYPDAWYFARPDTVQAVAGRLVRLRAAIKAERIAR